MVTEEYMHAARVSLSDALTQSIGAEIKRNRDRSEQNPETYNPATAPVIENCRFITEALRGELRFIPHLLANRKSTITWQTSLFDAFKHDLKQTTPPQFLLVPNEYGIYVTQAFGSDDLTKVDENLIKELWGTDYKHDGLFKAFGKQRYPQLVRFMSKEVEKLFESEKPKFW